MKLVVVLSLVLGVVHHVAAQEPDVRWGCQADFQMTGISNLEHLGAKGDSGGDWDDDGRQDLIVGGGIDVTTDIFLFTFDEVECPLDPCATPLPLELVPALVFENVATQIEPHIPHVQTGVYCWTSCGFVGDINGGGQDDIAFAEPFWSNGAGLQQCGRVFLYLAELHDDEHDPGASLVPASTADLIIEGDVQYGWFGFSLDGLEVTPNAVEGDLIVGAPGRQIGNPAPAGKAYVIEGESIMDAVALPGNVATLASLTHVAYGAASGTFSAAAPGDHFGCSVARIGNLNVDTREEFIVGAPQIDIQTSFVDPPETCTSGCSGGYARVFSYPSITPVRHLTASPPAGTGTLKGFGFSVAGVASVDSGPTPEILIGAPWYAPEDSTGNPMIIGAIYEYDGRTGTLLHGPIFPGDGAGGPDESWKGAALGFDLDGLEDFDGDGKGDILAGAPLFVRAPGHTPCGPIMNVEDMVGRVLVYSGPDGETILADYKGQIGGGKPRLGFSVAAGDVDADGLSDVYAGQLGWSEEPGAQEEGRAFVFRADPCPTCGPSPPPTTRITASSPSPRCSPRARSSRPRPRSSAGTTAAARSARPPASRRRARARPRRRSRRRRS